MEKVKDEKVTPKDKKIKKVNGKGLNALDSDLVGVDGEHIDSPVSPFVQHSKKGDNNQ